MSAAQGTLLTGQGNEAFQPKKRRPTHLVLPLVFVVLVAVAPFVVQGGWALSLLVTIGIYALFATSYNMVIGYAGVVSFGHAAFFAIGAYASAISATYFGASVIVGILIGMIVAVVVGLLVGLISLRIGGFQFALATLATAEGLRLLISNWTDFTNGSSGIIIPRGSVDLIPGVSLGGDLGVYYLVWICVLLALYILWRVLRSYIGSSFLSIRENEDLAQSVGIRPLGHKLAAFSIGSAVAAVAGSCYAYYYGIVTPEVSAVHYTALALIMVILGGRGTIVGPLVGAIVFASLPYMIPIADAWRDVIFGVVLFAVVLLLPRGLVPSISDLVSGLWNRKPRRRSKEQTE